MQYIIMLTIVVGLAVADIITGWIKAHVNDDYCSRVMRKGGTVSIDDGLEDFASDIATIPSGGGGGSSIENCFVGSATLPEAQFDTQAIETGFAPKIVGGYGYMTKRIT